MRKLVIDRKKWLKGDDGNNSCMLDDDGHMCCLGFVARRITKLSKERLFRQGTPADCYLGESLLTYSSDGTLRDNDFSAEAMDINDDSGLSEKEREKKLIKLFKKNDIELSFSN